MTWLCDQCVLGMARLHGLGDAKINDLGGWLTIQFRHKNVGRLQITMDDSCLVGVLNTSANLEKE